MKMRDDLNQGFILRDQPLLPHPPVYQLHNTLVEMVYELIQIFLMSIRR